MIVWGENVYILIIWGENVYILTTKCLTLNSMGKFLLKNGEKYILVGLVIATFWVEMQPRNIDKSNNSCHNTIKQSKDRSLWNIL